MAEKLFFFSGSDVAAVRAARDRGESVVVFSESAATLLPETKLPFTRAVDALGDDPEMILYRAAADWTKGFGGNARDGTGQSLSQALAYRGTTLWWWAELYLHHNTEAARYVRFLENVGRVIERRPVASIRTQGFSREETMLLERLCGALGIAHSKDGPTSGSGSSHRAGFTTTLLEAAKVVMTAIKPRGRPDPRRVPRSIVFVSHAAFWRTRTPPGGQIEDYEHYFDSLLALSKARRLPVLTLGVGPQSTFRTRSPGEKWRERLSVQRDPRYVHIDEFVTPRLAAAALKAYGNAINVHNRFRTAPSLRSAFSHRGVSFEDLSGADLTLTLLHQVPWAARCLLQFEAAFRELDPRLVCLYAESSGLGRAAIVAAKKQGSKTLGVQHGILYPNYFSYERTEAEVGLGTPIPDITAMYGDDGVRLLEGSFHYPKGRVVATGSPRYDALSAETLKVDRDALRKNLGVGAADKLMVLASRYTGIRETHKASGPAFAGLLAAVAAITGACLIVKPHPAEPGDAYDLDIAAANLGPRVRVLKDRSLSDILPAADVLITVESLSATEALVASVPVVVLRHPSNLRDVVASGAALGVPDGEDPRARIEGLLIDPVVREQWQRSRDAFLQDVAHGVDGKALDRLIALLSKMAALD